MIATVLLMRDGALLDDRGKKREWLLPLLEGRRVVLLVKDGTNVADEASLFPSVKIVRYRRDDVASFAEAFAPWSGDGEAVAILGSWAAMNAALALGIKASVAAAIEGHPTLESAFAPS